jgi:hypothetical protein
MKEKDGTYIALMWDGKPETYYIRGHILKNEACKELQSQQEIDPDDVAYVKYKYGRWGFSQHEDFNRNLYVKDEPSRGSFKITECVMKCL